MDDQLHLLTGAYALNALDAREARRFERSASEESVAEARELAEAAALLAEVDDDGLTPPPPHLKASVMEQIRRTPQLSRDQVGRDSGTAQTARQPQQTPPVQPQRAVGRTPEAPDRRRAQPEGRQEPPRRWRKARFALAAALLMSSGWGAGAYTAGSAPQTTASQQTAPEGSQMQMLTKVTAAEDAAMAAGVMDGANVSVTFSRASNMAVSNSMLPPPPKGKVYMLWLFDADGDVTAMGELGAAPDEHTPALGELRGGLSKAKEFGITIEKPGTKTPSYKPFMLKIRA